MPAFEPPDSFRNLGLLMCDGKVRAGTWLRVAYAGLGMRYVPSGRLAMNLHLLVGAAIGLLDRLPKALVCLRAWWRWLLVEE